MKRFDLAHYVVPLLVSGVVTLFYFTSPLRSANLGTNWFPSAAPPAPRGIVPPTLGEQLRSGQVPPGRTHISLMHEEFPDLERYMTEDQLRVLDDPKTPERGRQFILAEARRRKEGRLESKDMFGRAFR